MNGRLARALRAASKVETLIYGGFPDCPRCGSDVLIGGAPAALWTFSDIAGVEWPESLLEDFRSVLLESAAELPAGYVLVFCFSCDTFWPYG